MKRLLALLLSGVLLASSVPAYSYAAVTKDVAVDPVAIAVGEPAPGGSKTEPTTAGLETAIKTIKQKITIPKEYSQFNYHFSNSSNSLETYWSLNWSIPNSTAFIQVNCDSDYNITYYYQYDYDKKNAGVSKFLKSELNSKAEEFIEKIAPDTKGKLELMDSYYEGVYSGNYVYNYQRKNNGVAFPDNTVSVWVNSVTGEVNSASVNWLYEGTIPSSKATITAEEAKKSIKENMKMKLVYRYNYYSLYDKNGNSNQEAFLVYEPSINYISVDAKTGEVYFTRNQWIDTANYAYAEKTMASTSDMMMEGAAGVNLTEEEISKIDELKDIISKEKAIKAVTDNAYLYVDKNLKSYTAYLSKMENNGKTSYVWNITLADPREITEESAKDNYRAFAYASVDAKTGKILSYYASMKGYYDEKNNTWTKVNIAYDKKESREIFEKFIKAQMKDRFSKTILTEENGGYVAYYKDEVPVYGGFTYQYNRVNEGIEFPYNYINGSVDGVSGKIYSFNSSWDDSIKFESPKGVITADKAMDFYLGNDDFGLKYEINIVNKYDSKVNSDASFYETTEALQIEKEIRLVYRPDVSPAMISPFTGELMNYDGEIFKEVKPYTYADIKVTPENRNILILSDMNVGFEGDNFLPNQAITVGEMNKLIQDIGFGYGYEVAKDSKANTQITKEELAVLFINKLGFEKISKISGIYSTGFADENMIKSENVGAVALAKGLGIFSVATDKMFNPKSTVSRYDAVEYLFKFIAAQQTGMSY